MAETKSRIQKEFREKTGLIIDQPKPGFGNSNDGNTARRFFQNAELSAEITKNRLRINKNNAYNSHSFFSQSGNPH